MLKAEENTDNWFSGDLCGFEDLDKFSIDIDSLYEILSEQSDDPNLQSSPEELSCKKSLQSEATPGEINHGSFLSQNGIQEYDAPQGGLAGSSVCYPSENLEPTDSRAGMLSECMFEFPENSGMVYDHVNMESACDFDSPRHTCSLSLGDWSTSYVEHDTCSSIERDEGAMNSHFFNSDNATINQFPNCGSTFNFAAEDTNHISGCTFPENLIHLKNENGYEYMHAEGDNHSKCASHVSDITMTEESHMAFNDDCTEDLEALVRNLPASEMDITFTDAEMSLPNLNPSAINHSQAYDASNQSSMRSFSECFDIAADREKFTDSSKHFQPYRFDYPFDKREEVKMPCRKIEGQPLPSESMCTTSRTKLEAEAIGGISVAPESSSMAYIETNNCQDSFSCPSTAHCSPVRVKSLCEPVSSSSHLLPGIHSFILNKDLVRAEEKLTDKLFASEKVSSESRDVINEAFEGGYHSAVSRSSAFASGSGPCVGHASSHMVPDRSLVSSKQLKACVKGEKMDTLASPRIIKSHSTTFNCQIVKKSSSACSSQVDDDPDICILEDISDPRNSPLAVGHGKSLAISEHTASDSHYLTGSGSTRFRTVDERLTFRVALQDLSQPKTEASPPNGVLSVPLMRHQRIALSWMVQKETASLHCSGGILADDQGLGKTISTIALILKERPPSSSTSSMTPKQNDTKALNLDDDDDDFGVRQLDEMNQDGKYSHKGLNSSSATSENAIILTKGRPAAGTLIVCPTSVLRQWAEELHNKVTKEAELSVLVYHGSNRTKDPLDLVKYDVVVTTYSIVSMEVPKQPLVDKDDDEKVKSEDHGLSSMESSCKKRKYPPSCSNKKSRKDKKGTDGSLLESAARPLARVGWFRVVLDEAQSIKNHRTQVARACWGLRAKRRWCLSGTPIQNAVDDLYSYFRFLRYDPYAGYKSFCSMIKVPINRNPTTGYKKLQAVLKTIMLRRTKGTHIDGEPIINLPPKSVELKKVDFSIEERDFYSKLEADSRAQFNVYAAAGTVQQNYVNILLMLLRLRQACDHPFLVKGYDSTSIWSSSLEMAKKLPSEKQTFLLSCLEACLAICAICNDSPEEAVVTICGHVFCNQCISEHLTGDDHLCPAAQCKVHLNATSVFSSATLKRSLFDQSEHDVSAAQLDEVTESCSEGFYSSKIKAALEVLESLSNPSDATTKVSSLKTSNKVSRCQGNALDSHSVDASKDTPDTRIVNRKNDLDDSSTKVSEKAIVFSQWTRMLDLLEARLKTSSIQYRRLDGTMSVIARDKAVKDFNTLPEVTVMIMSLKAASLGLNMVAACHVLLLDLWWNPTTEDQAIDRAHRIGQTRPVTVLRLTVKDTVEDRILALQQKKREMVASAFGEDETGSRQSRLTVDDLKYLFMV